MQAKTGDHYRELAIVMAVFIAATLLGGILGDGSVIGLFLGSAASVTPFVVLAVMAHLSLIHDCLKYPTYILFLIIITGLACISFLLGAVSILPPEILLSADTDPGVFESSITPQKAISVFLLMSGCALAVLLSLSPLVKAVRVRLASRLDFSPYNRVHMIALAAVFAVTLIPLVPVAVTGIPPYLSDTFIEMIDLDGAFLENAVSFDIFNLFWTIAASFVVVGIFTKRTLSETLQRLGLTRPGSKELMLAVGFALALIAVFYVVDGGIAYIWNAMGWPATDSEAFEMFLVPFLTPSGIVIASICAGFGEEISVRGVLQPRFGIILPAMLFASLHAFQYNWDGIVSVFIAGIIFGLIRNRYSTTVSAVTHTTYDFVLFLALLLGFKVI